MAGAADLLSDQGFRIDGRRPGELRRVQCKMGVFSQADGSSYLEQVRAGERRRSSIRKSRRTNDDMNNHLITFFLRILIPIPIPP